MTAQTVRGTPGGTFTTDVLSYSLYALFYGCVLAVLLDGRPLQTDLGGKALRHVGLLAYGLYLDTLPVAGDISQPEC